MHYQEDDPSAHAILKQHILRAVPITAKAIQSALREHEELTHAYKRTVEEYERLRQLFDQLTEERTKELLKRNGTDAVVGAINALTEVVRQAVMPPMMQITSDKKLTPELIEQMKLSQMSKSIVLEPEHLRTGRAGVPPEGPNGSPR